MQQVEVEVASKNSCGLMVVPLAVLLLVVAAVVTRTVPRLV
jgi:hypothetical protein